MLKCYGPGVTNAPDNATDAHEPLWFDLIDPTEEETRRVEKAIALDLPTREEIREVEMSSRVRVQDDSICLNVPYFTHDENEPPSPLGLVVTSTRLVSIRYGDSPAFAQAAKSITACSKGADGATAFIRLTQAVVGQLADRLEAITAETGDLSMRILAETRHSTANLRKALSAVGHLETRLTRTRLTIAGLQRIVAFTQENGPDWVAKSETAQLKLAHKDLDVLGELDAQLTDKLQFLLDAVLGFINIDQNDVIKILTVASVASIPPVVLAGIWGMNFVHMPELKWFYGYPLALLAIALSVVIPLLWFKRRGWL